MLKITGDTPLSWAAAFNKNPEVIQLLIDKGGDVHSKNDFGLTPLHWAALGNKNPEIIQIFIDNGADVHDKRSEWLDTHIFGSTQ